MSNRAILLAVLVMVVWGGHNVVIKIAVTEAPPLLMLAARLVLTGLVLLPFVRLKREQLGDILRYGFWMNVVHLPAVFLMFSQVTAASGSVLAQLYVLAAALWGAWFYKEQIGWQTGTGIVLSFVGILILFGAPDVNFWGVFFLVILTFGALMRDDLAKKTKMKIDLVALMGVSSVAAAVPVFLASYIFEGQNWGMIEQASPLSLALIFGYQAILLTASHMCWQRLVSRYPMAQVPVFFMVVPLISLVLAVVFLGEVLTPQLILGGALILLGVGIVTIRRAQKAA
jgi:O-acetylserine/cysteine efflux transporter